jgi:NADPH:quinone reductase-like Zn-dependent oxidoreductase
MKAMELGTYKVGGAYADYCTTDAFSVFPLSDDIELEAAASFIVNHMTAVCMVERIK